MGCALVALVAPSGQLKQPQQLVGELSRCGALWGRPKVFLLLSSAPGGVWAGPLAPWLPDSATQWGGWAGGPRPTFQANVLFLHPAAPEPGAFLTGLSELCGRFPHWSLLQLLTEVRGPGPGEGESLGGGLCQSLPLALLYCPEPVRSVGLHFCPPLFTLAQRLSCQTGGPWRPELGMIQVWSGLKAQRSPWAVG